LRGTCSLRFESDQGRKQMTIRIKNATSRTGANMEKIQRLLSENGAQKVMMDYRGDGTLESITFAMMINGKLAGFRLPAMVDNVAEIMFGGEDRWGRKKDINQSHRDKAYITAWANIRDWLDAQMALVQTRQAEVVQIFLPYMVMKDDRTLYEQVISDPKFLLEK